MRNEPPTPEDRAMVDSFERQPWVDLPFAPGADNGHARTTVRIPQSTIPSPLEIWERSTWRLNIDELSASANLDRPEDPQRLADDSAHLNVGDMYSDPIKRTIMSSSSPSLPDSPDPEVSGDWETASVAESISSTITLPYGTPLASSCHTIRSPARRRRLAESDTIIIRTVDGTLVPAPHLLLTKYVTFFADLPIFLHAPPGTNPCPYSEPPLELPYATAGGLRLSLSLLRNIYLGEIREADSGEESIGLSNLQSIVDALILADVYDIPAIPSYFAKIAYESISEGPLYTWVIGTLAGGHPGIDFPSLIADTLQSEIITLPSYTRDILNLYIPDALAVLEADQSRWSRMLQKLKAELTSLAPMSFGFNRYSLKCLGRAKRYTKEARMGTYGPGCITHQDHPEWEVLRKETAESAIRAQVARGYTSWWGVEDHIGEMVKCERCSLRLVESFSTPLSDFQAQCPPRCADQCYYDAPKDYFDVDGPLVSVWARQDPGPKTARRAVYL